MEVSRNKKGKQMMRYFLHRMKAGGFCYDEEDLKEQKTGGGDKARHLGFPLLRPRHLFQFL